MMHGVYAPPLKLPKYLKTPRMRPIIYLLLFLLPASAFSQMPQNRKHRDVFPTFGNYDRKGWIIAPMITFTGAQLKPATQRLFTPDDRIYDVEYRGAGRPAVGIEVGRFYLTEHFRNLHSVEFSLGMKSLRGVERFDAVLDDPNRLTPFVLRGDGDFTFHYATAGFRANHVKQFSDFGFFQNSVGVNVDYRFSSEMRYNDRDLPITTMISDGFAAQINYRFGIGFKLTQNLLLVPSAETPILTVIQFDDMKSTMGVFNSRYRPILFRLSVYLLDKKAGRACPTKGTKRRNSESLFGMIDGKSPW